MSDAPKATATTIAKAAQIHLFLTMLLNLMMNMALSLLAASFRTCGGRRKVRPP